MIKNIRDYLKEDAKMTNENIDLAKEHIEIAKDIVVKEGRKDNKNDEEKLSSIEFSLEKAGAELESLGKDENESKDSKKKNK